MTHLYRVMSAEKTRHLATKKRSLYAINEDFELTNNAVFSSVIAIGMCQHV
jgi:hypothetical protein